MSVTYHGVSGRPTSCTVKCCRQSSYCVNFCAKMNFALALLLCLIYATERAHAETNYHKCIKLHTYGYSYDTLFKLRSSADSEAEVHFFVKSKSDAHILLTSSMDILDLTSYAASRQKVIEVLIGGGRNSFSSIRSGLKDSKISRTQVSTPDILSPDEFRSFWIKVSSTGYVTVGRENDTNPFMSASPFPTSMTFFLPSYFGLSSWNAVKGEWKLNCPNESHTEISGMDDIVPKGLAKLQWDLTSLYDPNLVPSTKTPDDDAVIVNVAMQVHHLSVNEHINEFTLGGKMFLSWYDARLRWYPADYDNISSFSVHPSEIWTPTILSLISKAAGQPILTDIDSVGAFVQSNGTVQWTPMFQLSEFTVEAINDNWPQTEFKFVICLECGGLGEFFVLEPDVPKVNLKPAPPEKWQVMEVRSEWNIVELSTADSKEHEDTHDVILLHRMLVLVMEVKRDTSAYLEVYVTPFAALATMTLSSFWIKPHQGAKLYLHCVTLVVLTCYIITLAERIPAHTAKVPVLFDVYTTSLILSCVAIMNYVLAKNLRYCTWSIPHRWRLVLTHPLMENILLTHVAPDLDDEKATLESKDWKLINILVDRLIFFVFLFVYVGLYIRVK